MTERSEKETWEAIAAFRRRVHGSMFTSTDQERWLAQWDSWREAERAVDRGIGPELGPPAG